MAFVDPGPDPHAAATTPSSSTPSSSTPNSSTPSSTSIVRRLGRGFSVSAMENLPLAAPPTLGDGVTPPVGGQQEASRPARTCPTLQLPELPATCWRWPGRAGDGVVDPRRTGHDVRGVIHHSQAGSEGG